MSIAVTPPSLWISKTNTIVSITFSIYKDNNLLHALKDSPVDLKPQYINQHEEN
jgi:hypothetical protein